VASSDWQRSKEVFQAALTRAPELRVTFLDEACGGDGELRREVHRLLTAHDAAGGEEAGKARRAAACGQR
jgi:hypothetical protein